MTFIILVDQERFLRELNQAVMSGKLDGADWMVTEKGSIEFYLASTVKVLKHVIPDKTKISEVMKTLLDQKFQILGVQFDKIDVKIETKRVPGQLLQVNDFE